VAHMKTSKARTHISLFGHFGHDNFGNESTLQAILYHLYRLIPNAEVTCICTGPETVAATYNILAFPIKPMVGKPWGLRNPIARLVRRIVMGIPSELYRWLKAIRTLRDTDMLIVPGTGLLTDAYGLFSWGPYNMFKWSFVAKLCGCKLFFVSVGAGPIYTALGRYFVKSALALADFRSYRDTSTVQYVRGIGVRTTNDLVYPDLAFSLPEGVIPRPAAKGGRRTVVGVGLMEYAGRYSVDSPSNAIYLAYLETLVVFVRWLLAHEYDVRLLSGDVCDRAVTHEFMLLLKERSVMYEGRLITEDIVSVHHLLSVTAMTDIVVATRFHNVLLALLLNRPVISISFHHKCVSLMNQMGLSEYSHDINHMNADRLIEQLCDLEQNAEKLRPLIQHKTEELRRALDEQYDCIFREMCPLSAHCPKHH
jgi:polysaccharide pyruvyl transferase WcaK-like protein